MRIRGTVGILATALFLVVLSAGPLSGQQTASDGASAPDVAPVQSAEPQAPSNEPQTEGLVTILLRESGLIGIFILLLSVAGVALAIEHLITIRAPLLMPAGLSDRLRDQTLSGRIREADRLCAESPSLLAYVMHAGLAEVSAGWSEVEKAAEEALAEQAARLYRKIEYLGLIGNISPMLGLLGTVLGMIGAFQQVAIAQGTAGAADLADGIYGALSTTVLGLLVAIPAVAAHAIFRNRVDQLLAEATNTAAHVLSPLKQRLLSGPPAPPG